MRFLRDFAVDRAGQVFDSDGQSRTFASGPSRSEASILASLSAARPGRGRTPDDPAACRDYPAAPIGRTDRVGRLPWVANLRELSRMGPSRK